MKGESAFFGKNRGAARIDQVRPEGGSRRIGRVSRPGAKGLLLKFKRNAKDEKIAKTELKFLVAPILPL